MDLTSVAAELYALVPEEFTAARNERAKDASGAGDKDLAAQIRRLPKPSAAAWVLNALVRHRTEDVERILDLGAAMRQAQQDLDTDTLRTLSRQRRQLADSLVDQGRALAGELWRPISEAAAIEVDRTLQAAIVDPAAAAAVRTGRLTRTLETNGLEPVDLAGAVAGQPADTASGRETPPEEPAAPRTARASAERHRASAQQLVTDAERRADQATADLEAIEARLLELTSARQRLTDELSVLAERIDAVEREFAAVDRERSALTRDRRTATRTTEEAKRGLSRAREQLDRVSAETA